MTFFDDGQCSLPSLPEPAFDYVDDCQVLPAPPGIFDCPDIEIPFDTPPPPSACPVLRVDSALNMESGLPPRVDISVLRTGSSSAGCEFLFDFDFQLPNPTCPNIGVSAGLTTAAGAVPRVTVGVTETGQDSSACAVLFDFDFELPDPTCPVVNVAASMHTSPGAQPMVTATVTADPHDSSACAVLFDFDFQLPDPTCPVIDGSARMTLARGLIPRVDLTITPRPFDELVEIPGESSAGCAVSFDFDFELPEMVCPTIDATGAVTLTDGAEPTVGITVTQLNSAPSACELAFDFDFELPQIDVNIACPTLTGTIRTNEVVDGHIVITQIETVEGEPCQYAFDFDFDFCHPQFQMQAQARVQPSLSDSVKIQAVTIQQGPCEFLFGLDIQYPCPVYVLSGSLSWGPTIRGDITAEITVSRGLSECRYKMDMDITIPGRSSSLDLVTDIYCEDDEIIFCTRKITFPPGFKIGPERCGEEEEGGGE